MEAVFARCRCVDSVVFRSCLGSRPRPASRACSLWAGRGILQLDRMLCRRQWRGVLGSERLVQSSVRGRRFRRRDRERWTRRRSGRVHALRSANGFSVCKETGTGLVPLPALPISRSHFSPTSQTPSRWPRSRGVSDTHGVGSCSTGRVAVPGCEATLSLQPAGAVFSVSETRSGWTVGVGGEYAFLDWLTGFIEYDHYGFRDDNGVSFGCGALLSNRDGGGVSNQYQNRRRCREGRPELEIRPHHTMVMRVP